jgi:hypothetical protein
MILSKSRKTKKGAVVPRKMKWIVSFGIVALCVAVFGFTLPTIQRTLPNQRVLCSDLRVTMDTTRDPSGMIHLKAKVCNSGPGKYSFVATPLDGFYIIQTWHPPKTAAQEGDTKIFLHTNLGTALAVNECKDFAAFDYQIPDFSRWGHYPPTATERQAYKQFTAKIEKRGGTGLTNCEDTNQLNSIMSVEVQYMEKIK